MIYWTAAALFSRQPYLMCAFPGPNVWHARASYQKPVFSYEHVGRQALQSSTHKCTSKELFGIEWLCAQTFL